MKVLVTGCAGFIGSNLCKELASKGIPFVGLDNFSPNYDVSLKRKNIAPLISSGLAEFIEADINDKSAFGNLPGKGITHVAHLAAKTGVRHSTIDPESYLQTNIIGTLNVLDFARENKVKRVVLASTSSVYGLNKTPFREKQGISTPLSVYAASKAGMEQLGHAFHHLHGLPITILRFFTVYGPGGRPDMAVYTFADRISAGKEIEVFGDGKARRDFTYVSDTVSGILLGLEAKKPFGIYNIGNNDSRSLKELIAALEKNLGRKAKARFTAARHEDVNVTLADISKAKEELGYRPKVGLEKGIPLFCEWFRGHKGN